MRSKCRRKVSLIQTSISPKWKPNLPHVHQKGLICMINPGPRIDPFTSHAQINFIEKKSFLVRKVQLSGSEMSHYPGRGTRQFTDMFFEDSSPTELKKVHRHFWRQFTGTFEDSLKTCDW